MKPFFHTQMLCAALLAAQLALHAQPVKSQSLQGWAYAELKNPHKTNTRAWSKITQPLCASFVDKNLKPAQNEPPQDLNSVNFAGETAWRGERIGFQILLWSGRGASKVTLQISNLENSDGDKIAASNASIGFVRYVMCEGFRNNICIPYQRKGADSALVADVIDFSNEVAIRKNTVQPVWLSIDIPASTPPGKYKGFVTISAKELLTPITLTVNVLVRNRTLPPPAQWSFYLDLWQDPLAVARYHNVTPWSAAHLNAMRPLMARLARCGQKTITIPLFDNCINSAIPNDFQSMLYLTKRIDNSWYADFTKFDIWVEFMMQQGIDRELCCHLSSAPTQLISFFDQATNSLKKQTLSINSQEYIAYLRTTLKSLAAHLREKNWMSKATLCLTNVDKETLRKFMRIATSVDSAYRIVALNTSYYADLASSVYRFCVTQGSYISKSQHARRNADKPLCFYVPCSDQQPATYLFSPSAEAAWVGWFAAANGYNGYTRTSYCSWNLNPLRDARTQQYAAGYFWLVYPENRTSVRLERLIEGVQNYEKIQIVMRYLQQNNNVEQRDRLLDLLKQFSVLNASQAADLVREAHALLNSL